MCRGDFFIPEATDDKYKGLSCGKIARRILFYAQLAGNSLTVDTGEGKGGAESEKVTHIYRALLVRICICNLIHDNGDSFRHDLSENHAGDCG